MNRFGFPINSLRKTTREKEYVVQKGDSLYLIANKYGVTVDDIIKANDLTNNLIYPNQVIVIPKTSAIGTTYFEEYIIKTNDTIDSISKKFDVSIDQLDKYNDFTKLILQEDQVINIPKDYKIYQIQDGDTLSTILDKTDMTLDELIIANMDNWFKTGKTIFVK